jgi:hypothetical protein
MSDWIVGIACGGFALLGAILAAGARDDGMYVFGLSLVAFGVFMVFFVIKQHYDRAAAASSE